MNGNGVFCLFCETSREGSVEKVLQNFGYTVISALAERTIIKKGKTLKELRSVIPGYVFFETVGEPDWNKIKQYEHIYYPLSYANNEKKLKGNDLDFVKWLIQNKGIIRISKAIEIGTKIKIAEGPLKDFEGNIVKINKKQKCAGIKLEGEGIKNIIWLSYEIIHTIESVPKCRSFGTDKFEKAL